MKNLFLFIGLYFVFSVCSFAAVQKIVYLPNGGLDSSISIDKKRQRQIKKMVKTARKLKHKQGDNDLNISLGIGLTLSVLSMVFLFTGLFGWAVLLGTIGGLICLQLSIADVDRGLSIAGAGLGIIGAIISFFKAISVWGD